MVREYAGARHEVFVIEGGFSCEGNTFPSLSAIAKEIIGTRWSGWRFFGLRCTGEAGRGLIKKPSRPKPQRYAKNDRGEREMLLRAVRRASAWVEAVRSGEAGSFAEIAAREELGERHVPWLAPLAFVSPRILIVILDGSAPGSLKVARFVPALAHSWAIQESAAAMS